MKSYNSDWILRQNQAARTYAAELSRLLEEGSSLRLNLFVAFAQNGEDVEFLGPSELRAVQQQLQVGGFSPDVIETLKSAGANDGIVSYIQHTLQTVDVTTGPEETDVSRSLAAAITRLAELGQPGQAGQSSPPGPSPAPVQLPIGAPSAAPAQIPRR